MKRPLFTILAYTLAFVFLCNSASSADEYEFKDAANLQVGWAWGSSNSDAVGFQNNSSTGFWLRGMASLVNAISDKREGWPSQ